MWLGSGNHSTFARVNAFGTLINMNTYFCARRSIVSVIVGAIFLSSVASGFAFDIGSLLNNKPKEPDKFAIIRVDNLA